jgi:hypothetical protein
MLCALLKLEIENCSSAEDHKECAGCAERPVPKAPSLKPCEKCRKTFRSNSNRQRFCPSCGMRNETLKIRDRQTKFRKSHKSGH